MSGWFIHMDVARRTVLGLTANPSVAAIIGSGGTGPDAIDLEKVGKANPAYLALGAIGPDIFFLLPDFRPPQGRVLWKVSQTVHEIYTWFDDNFLGPYESALGPIGANLADELNALSGGLQASVEGIFNQAFAFLKEGIIRIILEQYDYFGLLSTGAAAGYDEQTFFWSDMLHYRATYRVAATMWQRANDPDIVPDPVWRSRFQAFALGWMSHLGTDVVGHALVNQKVGGPYRLHAQRHHLVENHMDAEAYRAVFTPPPTNSKGDANYDQIANAALHLWIAFHSEGEKKGESRGDLFDGNSAYLVGDHSADLMQRHSVWDVDSDLPDELAEFLADTLETVYEPSLANDPNGMMACCPTIISSLKGLAPLETKGYPTAEDIGRTYWWLYHYLKWITTDYYKIRRPEPPEEWVIPSWPAMPGSGDSDPSPGLTPSSADWPDALHFLLSLLAWAEWLAECAVWPVAAIAGIVGGTATYSLRETLYNSYELPLYNLWLGLHTYLATTGYVMPMPGETNAGLTTLGTEVSDAWAATIAALGDPDGIATTVPGPVNTDFPRDVVVDPPNLITAIFGDLFKIGAPEINGQYPSEFTRPWRFPWIDNQGQPLNVEQPQTIASPFDQSQNALALLGGMPGSPAARVQFAAAQSEQETLAAAAALLPEAHLGDAVDYSSYLIAGLTRHNLEPATVANFNLDADRGYGYLCWDWKRDPSSRSVPANFRDETDPASGLPTDMSRHVYRTPLQPGYGWAATDQQPAPGVAVIAPFDPDDPQDGVAIRYIDREPK